MALIREYRLTFDGLESMDLTDLLALIKMRAKIDNADYLDDVESVF